MKKICGTLSSVKIEQKSVKTGEVLAKPSIKKTKDLPYPWMWHFLFFMAGTPHTHVKVSFLFEKK
ncbi:hypothetical protein BsIDN1_24430 [Bacillus safensis]|uniref:Uncharacterized protein n=1 Tax=Bacillus safensis TaxID=561879 RepID=A0A5S9M7J7_BACIA|nr:hypothetical protein BsIDN1_24430 [Bacillus safensis]